jgi:protein SCO1/2
MARTRTFFTPQILAVLVAILSFVACKQKEPEAPLVRHPLKGKILSIDKAGSSLMVDHEAIPDFMAAMIMPYPIKDPAVLEKVKAGDLITADVVMQEGHGYWLENVVVTGHEDEPPAKPAAALHIPAPGDSVPGFLLTNQDGRRISTAAYHGKVLLLTFIYTRCPFPEFCPRVSGEFLTVYHGLQKDPALAGKVRLLSVSLDPAYDTPKVLREYAFSLTKKRDDAVFRQWQFAAPEVSGLPKMANYFGLTYQEDKGVITHSLSTAVIGPDGKIFKWYHGSDWKAADLMKDAAEALRTSA